MDAPTDAELLQLAGEFRKYPGSREQAMRDRFDLSAVEFWRRVLSIVADPDPELAIKYASMIRVLRERRDAGMAQRTSRRAG